jgi:hypothetical protein
MGRTRPCDPSIRSGRFAKAVAFLDAAAAIEPLVESRSLEDAFVTLCVHAGIAAADSICCARLGVHASGDRHADAIDLLDRVDRHAARSLATLLGMKTRAGYSDLRVTRADLTRAGRAARALVDAARATVGGV